MGEGTDNLTAVSDVDSTPWGTGLTVAAFVAAVTAGAIVVLRVSVGLNVVAVGGLAPTLWDWRRQPVRRWFALGAATGVAAGWIAMLALAIR